MLSRIALLGGVLLFAGCSTPGSSTGGAGYAPLLARTATHEVQIVQGRCSEITHTCTPESDFGLQRALVVTLRPLASSAANCPQLSALTGWARSADSTQARPLEAGYARAEAQGCGFSACLVLGDGNAHLGGGAQAVTLSWQMDGQRVQLPQTVLLTRTPSGRFAVRFQPALLAAAGAENAAQ